VIVAAETHHPNARHRASPRARRLLHESGLPEDEVAGTGPDGHVLAADVEAALAGRNGSESEYWRESRLATSSRAVSHANTLPAPATALAFMAVEVDFFAVERVRRAVADAPAEHLPYVARAVLDALAAYPYLNAPHGDQTVVTGRAVHLGIAVDLEPDGMSVPVIPDAESLRLRPLADRLDTTIAAARTSRRRRRDSNSTGTFTIGNPTPYGPMLTAPPLGRRQVAALAIGAVAPKPVAIEPEPGDYRVAVHPVGTLGLSFDRDVIDGGYAARFLDHVRTTLESRDWTGEL
jgi:pyruvate/2-oxoglutarate dehydrogenase complex dihydrolipoamide acyltransferase (E2) component